MKLQMHKQMAKPIFIIRIPISTLETMGADKLRRIFNDLQMQLNDYHVLSMVDNHVTEAQFQCFNADNVPEIELDVLKTLCMQTLKENK